LFLCRQVTPTYGGQDLTERYNNPTGFTGVETQGGFDLQKLQIYSYFSIRSMKRVMLL
jgi:hypothetical protein